MHMKRLLLALFLLIPPLAHAAPLSFACGGELEGEVWKAWDEIGRAYARDALIDRRLLGAGDTYALYDLEITFHNLLAMAERCNRQERLLQFASDWRKTYSGLAEIPSPGLSRDAGDALPSPTLGRAWICRGGAVCNGRNRLAGKEVQLASAQGLGLLSDLAFALSKQPVGHHPAAEDFIEETVQASLDSLQRWGDAPARQRWRRLAGMSASSVHDGSSQWFFTDKELWQLGIYANVAGILGNRPELRGNLERQYGHFLGRRAALLDLLALFNSRLSLSSADAPRLGRLPTASIDRGFWRLYADYGYAGYENPAPPVQCMEANNAKSLRIDIPMMKVPPVANLGWDFSHARRLVPVLDALEQNRSAMSAVFGIDASRLPPSGLGKRFAGQILAQVWNGDSRRPLFANWLSGANGWYRVGYDNGTAHCEAGQPPYGLSSAFPTGGYIAWGRYYPALQRLGVAIFDLGASDDPGDAAFMKTHYPTLVEGGANASVTRELSFWPSLVGNAN